MTEPTAESVSDLVLSARISEHIDAIEEELPRLKQALSRRSLEKARSRNELPGGAVKEHVRVMEALKVLHDAARVLGETPQARAQAKAEMELARVWRRAKHMYLSQPRRDRRNKIIPWGALSDAQRTKWFEQADDRVPPTWAELTPTQKALYRGAHDILALPSDEAAAHHERNRQKNMRRRAYKRVQFAAPYRVLSNPETRMTDVTAKAQTLGWAREEHARGRVSDMELAVWEEHYRRAIHAYTRPFEPYPEP